ADGLSGDAVNAVMEDREGNIWVATTNGLDRFRDVAVSTLSARQGLPAGAVSSVAGSADGGLWMATPGAVTEWRDGHLTVHRGDRRASSSAGVRVDVVHGLPESIGAALADPERIWLASPARGLGYLERGRFVAVGQAPARAVRSMVRDGRGDLWVSDQTL